MRRIVLPFLVVALVGAGAFLALRDSSPPLSSMQRDLTARAEEAAALPAPAHADAVPKPAAERTLEEIDAPEHAPAAEEDRKSEDAADEASAVDGLVRVEGRVIVEEADGREVTDASGTFEATHWSGRSGSGGGTIAVTAGRFDLRAPRGSSLGIDLLELGGRYAFVEPEDARFTITDGAPLEVRAKCGRPVVLHVVDKLSRAELDDVTVVAIDDWMVEGDAHPGTGKRQKNLAEHARSPIELFAQADHYVRWTPTLFAMRPGCAWTSAKVDFHVGGEATIELESGSTLEVVVLGELPPLPSHARSSFGHEEQLPKLRLRRPLVETLPDLEQMIEASVKQIATLTDDQAKALFPDGKRPTEAEIRDEITQELEQLQQSAELGPVAVDVAADASGTTQIEGVAPGRYQVTLERGQSFDKPQVLAQAAVDIHAGAAAHVTLTIVASAPQRRVPLSGTLHLATEWNENYVDLHFEPVAVPGATSVEEFKIDLQQMRRIEGRPDLWRFNAGEILPGRWLVTSYSFEFQQIVETGPDGRSDAEIVIGDPADVVVHVIDDATGQPLGESVPLLWNCKRPEGSTGGSLDDATWDAATQTRRFRAPSGEVELSIGFRVADEFEPLELRVFTVRPGPNELTIRLRRAMGIGLNFTSEGRAIEQEALWDLFAALALIRIESNDLPAEPQSEPRFRMHGMLYPTSRAGRFVVHVPDLPGFAAIAPFEVTVRTGEITEQTIALVPKK